MHPLLRAFRKRRKRTLRPEELRIESFATVAPGRRAGTVFGEQCTRATNCTCPGCPTCDASCGGTCPDTPGLSCGGGCGGTLASSCVDSCDARTFDGCYGPTDAGFATIPGPGQQCIECIG